MSISYLYRSINLTIDLFMDLSIDVSYKRVEYNILKYYFGGIYIKPLSKGSTMRRCNRLKDAMLGYLHGLGLATQSLLH